MTPIWQIEMFGGLRLWRDGQESDPLPTRATMLLLVSLALKPKKLHSRDELLASVYPEVETATGRTRFRNTLSLLRSVLEAPPLVPQSVLLATHTTLAFQPGAVTTDVDTFLSLLQQAAQTETPADKLPLLRQALALYRGDLLPDFYEEPLQAERLHLAEQYRLALLQTAQALAACGEWEEAISRAEEAVQRDGFSEEAPALLMHLHAVLGRPAAVRQQYAAWVEQLEEAFHERPSEAMQAFLEQCLTEAVSRVTQQTKAMVGGEESRVPLTSSLPIPRTRFFGREEAIAPLVERLQKPDVGLVTLTGTGGTGKTRLALEVARRLREADPTGRRVVAFVPLVDITQAHLIPVAIADALDLALTAQSDPLSQVVQALTNREAWLVLDNFEQLMEEGTATLQTLLDRLPRLTLLVTSREQLVLSTEHLFPVSPLPTPDTTDTPEHLLEFSGVQLFVDRVQTHQPGFTLTPDNAATIVTLCQRLEGIPLALELAAAQMALRSPAQLVAELERRFAVLTTPYRDVPLRHRTLWGAIEWSYRRLPEALQRFFGGLSVFRGGWSVEAAEAVCEEARAEAYLRRLWEASLIQAEPQENGVRYRMLETLREFGWEMLTGEEQDALTRRHVHYFSELARDFHKQHWHTISATGLHTLLPEQENLRVVLSWGLANDLDTALRLTRFLWNYWRHGNRITEVRTWLALLLSSPLPATPHLRVDAMKDAGFFARLQGDMNEALHWLEQALQLGKEHSAWKQVAEILDTLGLMTHERGDYDQAIAYFREGLPLWDALPEEGEGFDIRERQVIVRGFLGHSARCQGDWERAQAWYRESLKVAQASGVPLLIARGLDYMGDWAHDQGDAVTSRQLYTEKLELFRSLQNEVMVVHSLNDLGNVASMEQDYITAEGYYREGLQIGRKIGFSDLQVLILHKLARNAFNQGNSSAMRTALTEGFTLAREARDLEYLARFLRETARLAALEQALERAARLYGAAERIQEQMQMVLPPWERPIFDPFLSDLQTALGESRFTEERAAGYALDWQSAILFALENR